MKYPSSVHRHRKSLVGTQQKLRQTNLMPLVLEFHSVELRELSFCYLIDLFCAVLLWLPEQKVVLGNGFWEILGRLEEHLGFTV